MDVNSSIADIAKVLEEQGEDEGCKLCKQIDDFPKKFYFESKKMMVINCRKCDVPIVVFKKHVEKARPKVEAKMIWHLTKVCDRVCGKGKWSLDKEMETTKDHVHYHGRPINKGEK